MTTATRALLPQVIVQGRVCDHSLRTGACYLCAPFRIPDWLDLPTREEVLEWASKNPGKTCRIAPLKRLS